MRRYGRVKGQYALASAALAPYYRGMNSKKRKYIAFLASPVWKRLREEALERSDHTCKHCGTEDELQVHHLNYERFGGMERPEDLIVLCRTCHTADHRARLFIRKRA